MRRDRLDLIYWLVFWLSMFNYKQPKLALIFLLSFFLCLIGITFIRKLEDKYKRKLYDLNKVEKGELK